MLLLVGILVPLHMFLNLEMRLCLLPTQAKQDQATHTQLHHIHTKQDIRITIPVFAELVLLSANPEPRETLDAGFCLILLKIKPNVIVNLNLNRYFF